MTFAINYITKKEKFDLILFVGKIKHLQFYFFKVPAKKHPQQLPMTYDILGNPDIPMEIIQQKTNWDFSLVNFDVR